MQVLFKKTLGFTLIEILVTMVILSIILLGLSPMMLSSMKGAKSSKKRSEATTYGQQGLEFYKNLLSDASLFDKFVKDSTTSNDSILDSVNIYQRIFKFDTTGLGENLLRINVKISWKKNPTSNTKYNVNLSTISRKLN